MLWVLLLLGLCAACADDAATIPVVFELEKLHAVEMALPILQDAYTLHFVPMYTERYFVLVDDAGVAIRVSQGAYCDPRKLLLGEFSTSQEETRWVDLVAGQIYTIQVGSSAKGMILARGTDPRHFWKLALPRVHAFVVAAWIVALGVLLAVEYCLHANRRLLVWSTINYLLCLIVYSTAWATSTWWCVSAYLLASVVLLELILHEYQSTAAVVKHKTWIMLCLMAINVMGNLAQSSSNDAVRVTCTSDSALQEWNTECNILGWTLDMYRIVSFGAQMLMLPAYIQLQKLLYAQQQQQQQSALKQQLLIEDKA